MKYILFNNKRQTGVWAGYYIFESLDDVKEHLQHCEPKYFEELELYRLGEKIEIQLNEVPFKGLKTDG